MKPRVGYLGAAVIAAAGMFVGATNERHPDAITSGVNNVVDPSAQLLSGTGDLFGVVVAEVGQTAALAGGAAAGAGQGAADAGGGTTIRVIPTEGAK